MRQSIYDVTNLEKKTSLNFFEFIWTWLRVKLISIHHISPVPTPQEVEFSSFIHSNTFCSHRIAVPSFTQQYYITRHFSKLERINHVAKALTWQVETSRGKCQEKKGADACKNLEEIVLFFPPPHHILCWPPDIFVVTLWSVSKRISPWDLDVWGGAGENWVYHNSFQSRKIRKMSGRFLRRCVRAALKTLPLQVHHKYYTLLYTVTITFNYPHTNTPLSL